MSNNFEAFKAVFQGDIVTADSSDYEAAIARWAANATRRAKYVVFVKSAGDITVALKFAKDEGLPIAIRGGGHSTAGASSQEGGLIIDLSRHLNVVRIDAEAKRAYIGGGAIWETVDKAAIVHGLASVAGADNTVCTFSRRSLAVLTVTHTFGQAGVGGLVSVLCRFQNIQANYLD